MRKKFQLNGEDIQVEILAQDQTHVHFIFEEEEFLVRKEGSLGHRMILNLNQERFQIPWAQTSGHTFHCSLEQKDFWVELQKEGRVKGKGNDVGKMVSPMPGQILKVMAKVGDQVKAGDGLLIMEAMKMEHTIKANCDGKISKVYFKEGDKIDGDVKLVELEANDQD
jgi:biotin carboxyl carrier protein